MIDAVFWYLTVAIHVAFSYCDKLVCADDKFSKSAKRGLGDDVVHKFFNDIVKEDKYCSEMMKELVMKKMRKTLRIQLDLRLR